LERKRREIGDRMKKKTKLIAGIIIIILIIGIIYFNNQKKSEDVIKIGFIGPLTGDGAIFGIGEKNAMELVKNRINANGGINGRNVEIIYEDGRCDSKDALSGANKLIGVDKVKVVFTTCDAETLAVAPIAEGNKVIQISTYGSGSKISHIGDYIFRACYSDNITALIAAQAIMKENKKIGIITEETSYPVSLSTDFKSHITRLGGTYVEEKFPIASKDVRTQLIKIINENPDAIFINPDTPVTGIVILKQIKNLNFKGKIFGNYFASANDVQKLPEADGLIYIADPILNNSKLKDDFLAEYHKTYGTYPDMEYPAITTYDSFSVIIQTMQKVGDDPDKIRIYLKNNTFHTILGNYGFDEKNDLKNTYPSASLIKNGISIPYEVKA